MGVDAVVERLSPVAHVGVHAVGENTALAPVGSPVAEKATDWVAPEISAALIVLETEAP